MFLTMRLPGMCTLLLALTFAGRTVLLLQPNGCSRGKDLIGHTFWMATSLRNRSRNFWPLPAARPPNVESAEKLVELTYTAAFLAGMISFLSPCVLPLVPGFVGTMTGLSAEQLQEDGTWRWRGILFFGLVLLRLLPFKFLNRDMRFHREIRQGKLRSFLLGLAFAFGWTPCAGPALAATLMMAATRESVWQGTGLLAVYSAGLAIPFVIVALSISRFLS